MKKYGKEKTEIHRAEDDDDEKTKDKDYDNN